MSESITVKVKDLKGAALNYAVRFAETGRAPLDYVESRDNFAACWNKAGPIIEREKIRLDPRESEWQAQDWQDFKNSYGPTLLMAAMRCYVAAKLGDSVSVPAYLLEKVAQP